MAAAAAAATPSALHDAVHDALRTRDYAAVREAVARGSSPWAAADGAASAWQLAVSAASAEPALLVALAGRQVLARMGSAHGAAPSTTAAATVRLAPSLVAQLADHVDRDGLTILHLAARSGAVAVVAFLLDCGLPCLRVTARDLTVEDVAREARQREAATTIVEWMRRNGDSPAVRAQLLAHVLRAAGSGNVQRLKDVATRHPPAMCAADDAGDTAFHHAARAGRIAVLRYLLLELPFTGAGAMTGLAARRNSRGWTPLALAILSGATASPATASGAGATGASHSRRALECVELLLSCTVLEAASVPGSERNLRDMHAAVSAVRSRAGESDVAAAAAANSESFWRLVAREEAGPDGTMRLQPITPGRLVTCVELARLAALPDIVVALEGALSVAPARDSAVKLRGGPAAAAGSQERLPLPRGDELIVATSASDSAGARAAPSPPPGTAAVAAAAGPLSGSPTDGDPRSAEGSPFYEPRSLGVSGAVGGVLQLRPSMSDPRIDAGGDGDDGAPPTPPHRPDPGSDASDDIDAEGLGRPGYGALPPAAAAAAAAAAPLAGMSPLVETKRVASAGADGDDRGGRGAPSLMASAAGFKPSRAHTFPHATSASTRDMAPHSHVPHPLSPPLHAPTPGGGAGASASAVLGGSEFAAATLPPPSGIGGGALWPAAADAAAARAGYGAPRRTFASRPEDAALLWKEWATGLGLAKADLDVRLQHLVIDAAELPWERDAEIGSGSYGIVYRSEYRGQDVAVKVLRWSRYCAEMRRRHDTRDSSRDAGRVKAAGGFESAWEAVLSELAVITRVGHHDNIVQVRGVLLDPLAIVTEYMPLGSIALLLVVPGAGDDGGARTSRRHEFSLGRVVELACDVAAGLMQMHYEGVLHRDVAARNVLFNGTRAKLSDFGMARLAGPDGGRHETDVHVGTPEWMAPEAINNDFRKESDVYSFGVLLYELLTGLVPWAHIGGSGTARLAAIVTRVASGHRLRLPAHLPRPLVDLMEDCWRTSPAERPTMEQVWRRLRHFLADNAAAMKVPLPALLESPGDTSMASPAAAPPAVAAPPAAPPAAAVTLTSTSGSSRSRGGGLAMDDLVEQMLAQPMSAASAFGGGSSARAARRTGASAIGSPPPRGAATTMRVSAAATATGTAAPVPAPVAVAVGYGSLPMPGTASSTQGGGVAGVTPGGVI